MAYGRARGLWARLFGTFEVWIDGAPVTAWGSRRADHLLKLLLIFRERVFTTDQLVEHLHPGQDPAKVGGNVRAGISDLRFALEPDLARGPASTYVLSPSKGCYTFNVDALGWLDVEAFDRHLQAAERGLHQERWHEAVRHYDQALELYRGELLIADVDQEWATELRRRYRTRAREAQEQRAESLERLGRFAEAIDAYDALLSQDPTCERIYRALMRCHGHLGNRGHVDQVFTDCREALQQLLDVAPSADTEALYKRLRRESPPALNVAVPHNLPTPLTTMVGREDDVAALQERLADARLLTLTGVGGCGKTRLALEVAWSMREAFEDGVWWVDLSASPDSETLPFTVAAALGVEPETAIPSETEIIDHFRSKRALLVLDNCEHVVDLCADYVTDWLQSCPQLTVLGTSREPLRASGEEVWTVRPLAVPTARPTLDRLRQVEAVRLFLERASAADSGIELQQANREAVCEVCRRLDGLPLALELVAARLRSMSVETLARQLRDQLAPVHASQRSALPHHRTLHAALDWSHDLLCPDEQVLLRRLSVFRGPFSWEAVRSVCGDGRERPTELRSTLDGLVEKSLIEREGDRFRLFEIVRRYAEEKLASHDDPDRWRRRHLAYLLDVAEHGERALSSPQQTRWLHRLGIMDRDFRSALRWGLDHPTEMELGIRLAVALGRFWFIKGRVAEGRHWLERALAAETPEVPVRVRGRLRLATAMFAHLAGDPEAERAHLERSIALLRDAGDRSLLAGALATLSGVMVERGQPERARELLHESRQLSPGGGQTQQRAVILNQQGEVAWRLGDLPGARSAYREALGLNRRLEDRHAQSINLANLGEVAEFQGERAEAARRFRDSLAIRRELDDRRGMGVNVVRAAGLVVDDDPRVAARLLGAAYRTLEEAGARPHTVQSHEATVARLHDRLGQPATEAELERGRELKLDRAVSWAIERLTRLGQPDQTDRPAGRCRQARSSQTSLRYD